MLQALGYGFLDKNGNQIPFGARGLKVLETITETHVLQELKECRFRIACDVTNSLCGEPGVQCCLWSAERGNSVHGCGDGSMAGKLCGTGRKKIPESRSAAGRNRGSRRTGFAFLTFTDAVLESGIKIVLEETRLEEYIREAGLGDYRRRTDGRTDRHGESTDRSSRTCKEIRKDCDAFTGAAGVDAEKCNEHGIDAFFPILRNVVTLEEAMKNENAKRNLADTAEQVYRLWRAGTGSVSVF